MNLLLLELLARDLRGLLGRATLGTATWYAPVFTLPVRTGRTWRYLVAILETPGPVCFLSDRPPLEGAQAPERMRALAGATVTGVERAGDDRLLRVEATPRDAPQLTLVARLYGSQGQVALMRADAILETVGSRSRSASPADRPTSVVHVEPGALADAVASGEPPQRLVPGADPGLVAAFAAGGEVDVEGLVSFRDEVLAGGKPYALVAHNSVAKAVPVPAGSATPAHARGLGPFDDAIAACAQIGDEVLGLTRDRIVARLSRPLRQRIVTHNKLIANLQKDIERAQTHERLRRETETLAAYQSSIEAGKTQVELTDIYDPSQRVVFELDPAEPIHVQVERRFKKATKLEKSLQHAQRRLGLVKREVTELTKALGLLAQTRSFADALIRLEAIRGEFNVEESSTRRSGERKSTSPAFRSFDLGEHWFVLVGRNNKDNDDLTFHHANPTDLWFHAQGVPGSHVVLRSRGGAGAPPATVIEAAASVAAHFSKARHSALVPVIYTQRKYVRKFRGAKPGQVVCERETMVMVAPAIPGQA